MTDPKVLRHFGTTNEALRSFFTAHRLKSDEAKVKRVKAAAEKFTKWISRTLDDGRKQSIRYYKFYAAADLMWDSSPILPEVVPLMAYAQGKIDFAVCEKELGPHASKFIENKQVAPEKPGGPAEIKKVLNLQKLSEAPVNIGRSYITRRVDAQCNQYNNLRPQFKYDPRDSTLVGRCRADAMSEYADIMAEGYGLPHVQRQSIRDMLMYSRSVMFPACAWDQGTTTVFADAADSEARESEGADKIKRRVKTRVVREGVPMLNVHPSRVIYDSACPLATINTDTGCTYVGFWDVKRYGDLMECPAYFNTDKIAFSKGGGSLYAQHRAYFDILYGDQPINFPPAGTPTNEVGTAPGGVIDLAATNDRTANLGLYTSEQRDSAIFMTDFRVKVRPCDYEGMGDYPGYVWLRLLVASDDTVIYAEWLPSLPAIYWGHNENDAKMVNLGQMHEIMPWQDHLTNIFTQLIMVMKRSIAQIVVLNTDIFGDDEAGKAMCAKVRADLTGDAFYQTPKLLEVSLKRFEKMGISVDAVLKIVEPARIDSEYITNALKAAGQIIGLLERLMMMSPQEQGQAAKHEMSATETAVIQNTTQVKFEAISESVNEARAAWKRLIFESAQAHGSEQVELSITQRYSPETIKAAGFISKEPGAHEGATPQKGCTVIGAKTALVHNYLFTSRDGANRFSDQQSANTLVQAMGQLLPLVGAETLGKERIFTVFNTILRLLGLPPDLLLRLEEGEADKPGEAEAAAKTQSEDVAARLAELERAIQALGQQQPQLQQELAALGGQVDAIMRTAPASAPAPAEAGV